MTGSESVFDEPSDCEDCDDDRNYHRQQPSGPPGGFTHDPMLETDVRDSQVEGIAKPDSVSAEGTQNIWCLLFILIPITNCKCVLVGNSSQI